MSSTTSILRLHRAGQSGSVGRAAHDPCRPAPGCLRIAEPADGLSPSQGSAGRLLQLGSGPTAAPRPGYVRPARHRYRLCAADRKGNLGRGVWARAPLAFQLPHAELCCFLSIAATIGSLR